MKKTSLKYCLVLTAVVSAQALAADAKAERESVRRAVHVCDACHGEGGRSTVAVYPKLAGQQPLYIAAQLRAFRDQKRHETDIQAYMWGISALLDDETIEGLAEHYANQPPAPGKPGKPALTRLGKQIFHEGVPARDIRACATCHGDNAEGAAGFPRLAGQHAAYVANSLKVFRTRLRPHGVVMTAMTKDLTPNEILAVAEYVQSLPAK